MVLYKTIYPFTIPRELLLIIGAYIGIATACTLNVTSCIYTPINLEYVLGILAEQYNYRVDFSLYCLRKLASFPSSNDVSNSPTGQNSISLTVLFASILLTLLIATTRTVCTPGLKIDVEYQRNVA